MLLLLQQQEMRPNSNKCEVRMLRSSEPTTSAMHNFINLYSKLVGCAICLPSTPITNTYMQTSVPQANQVTRIVIQFYVSIFISQIFDGYYHFEHRHVQKRSLNPSAHHQRRLDGDDRVRWAKQQRAKRRQKRDFRPLKSPYTIQLNDPKWPEMWYLVSRGVRSLPFAAREVDGRR